MKRFADFADEEPALDGDKRRLDDLLNRQVTITGYRIRRSRFSKNKTGEYLTLQVSADGLTVVCFTGSDVLMDQMKKYGDQIPFETTIKKINRYYTLT
jgi:hypothetical protein